ncbi:MAG TPA: hypothetical protein VFE05_15045 [Longimicrobiaceae bacterium]|nr:hypothetical protein [Longimicrobiaceae bacterium]
MMIVGLILGWALLFGVTFVTLRVLVTKRAQAWLATTGAWFIVAVWALVGALIYSSGRWGTVAMIFASLSLVPIVAVLVTFVWRNARIMHRQQTTSRLGGS